MRSDTRPSKRAKFSNEHFAGITPQHDAVISLSIYGTALEILTITLDQVDQQIIQLVPWPNEDSDTLVDRFDCRILLDPKEISPTFSTTPLESDLDLDRYLDLPIENGGSFDPTKQPPRSPTPPIIQHENHCTTAQYAAIGFTYDSVPLHKTDSHGVPHPSLYSMPYFEVHPNILPHPPTEIQPAFDGHTGVHSNKPFTMKQYAVMQSTAKSIARMHEAHHSRENTHVSHLLIDHAILQYMKDLLHKDVDFAFLYEGHVHHEFFRGLLDYYMKNSSSLASNGKQRAAHDDDNNAIENPLAALKAQYGSDSENEGERSKNSTVHHNKIMFIMDRLVQYVRKYKAPFLALVYGHYQQDADFSFLSSGGKYHDQFLKILEHGMGYDGFSSILRTAKALYAVSQIPKVDRVDDKKEIFMSKGEVLRIEKDRDAIDNTVGEESKITKEEDDDEEEEGEGDDIREEKYEGDNEKEDDLQGEKKRAERRKKARILLPSKESTVQTGKEMDEEEEKKRAERRKKAQMLLLQKEKERQLRQQEAVKKSEQERIRHLNAISKHKQAFFTDDD